MFSLFVCVWVGEICD